MISGDGLGVAFRSTATNLVPNTPGPAGKALYLRRLSGATTEAVNRLSGAPGELDERPPGTPSLGATPSFVAWGGDQLAFGLPASEGFDSAFGRGDFDEVFRRELTGASRRSSSRSRADTARNSGVGDAELRAGAISADGRFVASPRSADGLVPAGVEPRRAGLRARQPLNTTTLVSRAAGDGPPRIRRPPGGRDQRGRQRVAFIAFATNLVQGVSGGNVYVRTLATGELRIASRGDGPEGGPLSGSTSTSSAPARRSAATARASPSPRAPSSDGGHRHPPGRVRARPERRHDDAGQRRHERRRPRRSVDQRRRHPRRRSRARARSVVTGGPRTAATTSTFAIWRPGRRRRRPSRRPGRRSARSRVIRSSARTAPRRVQVARPR